MTRRRLIDRLDDAINPIVVKELRQAVQSRFVSVALLLFLGVQLSLLGFFLSSSMSGRQAEGIDLHAGRDLFTMIQVILLLTCMVFVPAYAGIRLAAEHSDTNVDLLFISTLRPRSIILGKFLATLVLIGLVFSACAPFMAFSYLLRGIDLPTVLLVLAADALVVLGTAQLAIFLATILVPRPVKALIGMVGGGCMLVMMSITMGMTTALIQQGPGFELDSWDNFWGPVLAGAGSFAGLMGLFFVWSVAVISPPSANRALTVRLYLLAFWLVSGLLMAGWSHLLKTPEPLYIWMCVLVVIFCVQLMQAINEREQWSPRVARTIPRRLWLRLPAFLLYSGAAGGVLFAVGLMTLTLLATLAWHVKHPAMLGKGPKLLTVAEAMLELSLYTICYSLSGVLLRCYVLVGRIKPLFTWIVSLILFGLLSAGPYIFDFMLYYDDTGHRIDPSWLRANPVVTVWDIMEEHKTPFTSDILYFTLSWAIVAGVLNLPWLVRQIARFQPYSTSPPQSEPPATTPADAVLAAAVRD